MKTDFTYVIAGAWLGAWLIVLVVIGLSRGREVETAPPPAPDRTAAIFAELQAEIEAREAELDQLANTLASAVTELHEAAALLRERGIAYEIGEGGAQP